MDQQAAKILRNLQNEEAFYFYENVGKPTGECAKSLSEFLNKVNTATMESLQFHLERGDFQNWIKDTLGDVKLADMIGRIAPANNEKLRIKIREILGNRLSELKDAFIRIEVGEELAVTR